MTLRGNEAPQNRLFYTNKPPPEPYSLGHNSAITNCFLDADEPKPGHDIDTLNVSRFTDNTPQTTPNDASTTSRTSLSDTKIVNKNINHSGDYTTRQAL